MCFEIDWEELHLKTPTEVIAALSATGTGHGCILQRLVAIREWLATPDGQAYVADLSEQPGESAWVDDFIQTYDASVEPAAS